MSNSEQMVFLDKRLRIRWELPEEFRVRQKSHSDKRQSCRMDLPAAVLANARTEAMTTPFSAQFGGSIWTPGQSNRKEIMNSDDLLANHQKTGIFRI